MTNIVVLDGVTLNPGDLSWKGLEQLGECTIYDRSAPEETIQRAAGAKIILTNAFSRCGENCGLVHEYRLLKYA